MGLEFEPTILTFIGPSYWTLAGIQHVSKYLPKFLNEESPWKKSDLSLQMAETQR